MKFQKLKKLASAVGLAVGLAFGAGSAQGLVIALQDDDIDFVYRNGSIITTGPLLVGDILVAAIEIPTATIGGAPLIPAGQEMTGVAAIQIAACTGPGGACSGAPGTQIFFAAPGIGLNAILALGGSGATVGAPGAAGGGATLSLWFNGTSDVGGDRNLILDQAQLGGATNCTSFADCVDQGSRGSLFQVDGFRGDPDELWVSTIVAPGGGDIGTVLGTNASIIVASFQAFQSTFFNSTGTIEYQHIASGLSCGTPGDVADGCVQFVVSGTATGGAGLVNGAFSHSDFDAQKLQVPEPGSLALLALGLGALGFGVSRRRKAAA